jgi:hypothetical protein
VNDTAGHGPAGLAARLGIFARTFPRATPEEVAAAVSHAGYPLAHWNFTAIGRSTLAGDVDAALVTAVRRAFDGAGVAIPSVSATFNLIHPDSGLRADQTAQAVRLIGLVPDLGADVVTLCSGTCDPDDMWRAHPGNLTTDAWTAMRRTLDGLLDAAGGAGVRLGIEPEPGNVIRDARTAARLLDELGPTPPSASSSTRPTCCPPSRSRASPRSSPKPSPSSAPASSASRSRTWPPPASRPPAPACWTTPPCSAP